MDLRLYQVELSNKATTILNKYKLVYLSCQPRVGKTLIALQTAQNIGASNVLFITKIKAFSSIENDYEDMEYDFKLTVINKESIHKLDSYNFDLIIYDEAHGLFSTYPKPNNFYKFAKANFSKIPAILLSGTPAVESYSQIFHQFNFSIHSPFKEYINFYKWSKDYVIVTQKKLGYGLINDYSNARIDLILNKINPYMIKFTQAESGFTSKVNKQVLYCNMKPVVSSLIKKLLTDNIIEGKDEVIIADTSVKLQQKIHQLGSGTIKFESGNSKTIDNSKAVFIKDYFKDKKLAIIYYFKEELKMLQEVFSDSVTTDLSEFNTTDKHYIGQQVSSCEGINLSKADCLVFLNIGFSGKNFVQAIDRLTTKERTENNVYFILSKDGIDKEVFNRVSKKETFNNSHFKRYAREQTTK